MLDSSSSNPKPGRNDNFFQSVYEVVQLIPFGRVTSYGAIATYLGSKGSARMVGWAMNASHTQPDIPAHRVLNRQGLLTGQHHFGEPNRMADLLRAEGIIVEDNQVQGLANIYWDPAKELAM
jgi:methylated-DNA-protein-cysteine methyltransferase-like protein